MVKIVVYFFILFFATQSYAQTTGVIDRLLLNAYNNQKLNETWDSESIIKGYDGSIFIGKQLGVENSEVIFRLNTKDTITIPLDLIKNLKGPNEVIIYPGGKYHYKSNIFVMLTNGYSASNDNYSVQLNGLVGMRFNERFAAGVGIGYESHQASFGGIYLWDDFTTLYGYGRYFINENKRRLFTDLKVGYGFAANELFSESHDGGALFQPGVGIILPSRKHTRWVFSAGYVFQYTEGQSQEPDIIGSPIVTNYEIWYRRFIFSFGIEIN